MADGVLQYIGARYVPTFYNNSDGTTEWRSGVAYEPLTIVSYNNNSYTSRKPVPAEIGNPSQNNEYWAQTGVYNAQIGQLQNEVATLRNDVDQLQEDEEQKIFWYTPEMFGAVGDNETDDGEALEQMFNTVEAGSHIVMSGHYLCRRKLTISKSELKISGGFVRSEYTPALHFEVAHGQGSCLYCTGAGLGFSNIIFEGTDRDIEDYLVELDGRNHDGNIDAIFTHCGFFKAAAGILAEGRNVLVSDSIFSSLTVGVDLKSIVGLETEYRGFVMQGNRIHTLNTFVRSTLSLSGTYRGIVVINNYADFILTLVNAVSGSVFIKNNVMQRFTRSAAPAVLLNENPNDNTDFYDEISDNTFEGSDFNNSRGLELIRAKVIVKGNNFVNYPQGFAIGAYGTAKVICMNNVFNKAGNNGACIYGANTVTGLLFNNVLTACGSISSAGWQSVGNQTVA